MKDWMPVIVELIWPTFIGIVIVWNRKWFSDILGVVRERIHAGSSIEFGPGGIAVGEIPSLPDLVDEKDIIDDGYEPTGDALLREKSEMDIANSIESQITLKHRSSYWKTKNDRPYFRISLYTVASNNKIKSKISYVIYHLHPTFKNPIRTISTASNDFLLKTNAWGEFAMTAEVYLKDEEQPIILNRFIDLKL